MTIEQLFEKKRRAEEQARALLAKEDYSKDDDTQAEKWIEEAGEHEARIQKMKKVEAQEAEEVRKELEREQVEKKSEPVDGAKITRDYLMGEISAREANEQRADATQTTTTTAGGYLIPDEFKKEIVEAMLAYGGVYANSYVFRTPSGNKMYLPYADDTSNKAYLVAESTDPAADSDNTALSWSQESFDSFKYTSGLIRVPVELLQDQDVNPDLVAYINRAMATRMNRGLNTLFTTGGGTNTIEGVVTGSTNSSVTPDATAITRDNILDLFHDVDPAYRLNAKFMFNDSTLNAIKKLSFGTADDRPLWQPSIRVGEPDTIEGKPYIINQDMADIAASAISVLFGDFSYYYIREVADWRMVRLNERYAEQDQVGFTLFARYDAKVMDAGTNPIKKLTHASS